MEKPIGPFGTVRPLNLKAICARKLYTLYASGYLAREAGEWVLTERGQNLYYFI
jgi:hypothetical protein